MYFNFNTRGEHFFSNLDLQIYGNGRKVWRSWILRKVERGKSSQEKLRDYQSSRLLSEVCTITAR